MAQTVESACSAGEPASIRGLEDPLEKERAIYSHYSIMLAII